jgi:hypothetical protein
MPVDAFIRFAPVPLTQVLSKINQTIPVEIEETTPGYGERPWRPAEWLLLRSETHNDHQVWNFLKSNWRGIVGLHAKDFALIYCRHDPYKGVWLHYLPTDEYAPGCHVIPDWSGPGDEGPEERNSGRGRAAF